MLVKTAKPLAHCAIWDRLAYALFIFHLQLCLRDCAWALFWFRILLFYCRGTSRIKIQVRLVRWGGQKRHWRDVFCEMGIDLVITCFNCTVEGKGTQLLFCGKRNAFLCLETIPNTEKNIKFYEHLFKGFKCKLTLMYSTYVSCHITKPTIREK